MVETSTGPAVFGSQPPPPPPGSVLIKQLRAQLEAERVRREAAENEALSLQGVVAALRDQALSASSSHEVVVDRLKGRIANQQHFVAALREHGKRMENLLRAERARKRARTSKLPRDASAASTVDDLPSPWREDIKAMQQRCRVLKSLLLGTELLAPDDQRLDGIVSDSDIEDQYEADWVGSQGRTQEVATPDEAPDSPDPVSPTEFYTVDIGQTTSPSGGAAPPATEPRPIEHVPATDESAEFERLD